MELDDVKREILLSGLKDLIGLWETEKALEMYRPALSPEERRRVALKEIGYLLAQGLMVAGERTPNGFIPSKAEPAAIVAEIETRWRALEGELTPVDEAWFKLSDAGRQSLSEE